MAPENDILADVAAAAEQLEISTTETPEKGDGRSANRETAPPAEPPAPQAKPRDDKGRFEKMREERERRETLRLNPKPAAPTNGAVPTNGARRPAELGADGQPLPAIAAPKAWNGGGKIEWDRLPRPVREQIAKDYEGLDGVRGELAPLKSILDEHRQSLVAAAGSVPRAVEQLIQFHNMYLTNPGGLAQHILRSAGIDPRTLFGQPQQQPNGQPDISRLLDQAVAARIAPIQQEIERRETQQIQSEVERFQGNSAQHPYFEDVRHYMGHLIRSGAARNLQEAYDQAIWANPTIRATLTKAEAEKAKTQAAAGADRARQAQRVSVSGAPVDGAETQRRGRQRSSVLDDVREAAETLRGA